MYIQSLLRYFLRGLLLVTPVSLTVYIIVEMVKWTDSLLPISIPGLGMITVLFVTAFIGYLANTLFAKPFFDLFNDILKKIPIVSFLYTAINDLVTAFVGDKKKFDTPVLVPFDEHGMLYKPGFITQKDLSEIGLPGMVTVYLPHSYNFSGNVFIVDKSRLMTLEGSNTELMKYIVSGGVSGAIKRKP
ncbi:DUF502 domain-containing protein [Marinoscillum sp. 108]|jgi:uncharacterized membrane protein|uniref:DUF502 domain-containing protein n=1 Tax=Marinoscillum luteum TaxID=861051 RepID=A0ABW7N3Q7_9BACT|nr:DUF502 domain-containing protein [Marinoscillum sp. 108]VXD15899.1 putative membrane protein [Marinoscillum sp. 108]